MKYKIFNNDCLKVMAKLPNDYVNLTLTDIPYDMVNRSDNGLRNLDKGNADILTFDLENSLTKYTG